MNLIQFLVSTGRTEPLDELWDFLRQCLYKFHRFNGSAISGTALLVSHWQAKTCLFSKLLATDGTAKVEMEGGLHCSFFFYKSFVVICLSFCFDLVFKMFLSRLVS